MTRPLLLLDTNTCIYIINKRPPHVAQIFRRYQIGEVALSSITVAELAFGAAKSHKKDTKEVLEEFLLELVILPFNETAAWVYGEVRAHLQRQGQPIGPLDMQIAAHALSLGLPLVTNNEAEFRRIPDLVVENWFPEQR